MMVSQQIALWADKLRDIAAWGLRNSKIVHDKERYRAVQDTSMAMMALATGESIDSLEPLRAKVFSKVTPVTIGGAAVINSDGEILLIRRFDDGKWAMPSGALEVGETPAQGAARETLEETGVLVKATRLIGIFDSRFSGRTTAHHIYMILFLCEPTSDNLHHALTLPADEVVEVQWFLEENLPTEISPGHDLQIPVAFRAWHTPQPAFFDGIVSNA
jgi:ADP-ribose pyrophosphatase YjhB (NUDIX family)